MTLKTLVCCKYCCTYHFQRYLLLLLPKHVSISIIQRIILYDRPANETRCGVSWFQGFCCVASRLYITLAAVKVPFSINKKVFQSIAIFSPAFVLKLFSNYSNIEYVQFAQLYDYVFLNWNIWMPFLCINTLHISKFILFHVVTIPTITKKREI